MERAGFTPYEGEEKYIFVSYAHKNSVEIIAIMEEMERSGYRIWYDDGIAPGSEWPEYIADHLNRASVFLAFISPESIESSNCRREVTYALSKQKPFLGVIMTPTEMSPGMELQLSSQQCILKYKYASEADFLEKLFSAEMLLPCKKSEDMEKVAAESQPDQKTDRYSETSADDIRKITDEDMAAVEQMASFPGSEKDPEVSLQYIDTKHKGRRKKRFFRLLIIILAVAAGLFLMKLIRTVRISNDQTVDRNTEYITLDDFTITDENLKSLNKLKHLTSLTIKNCNVETNLSDLSRLKNLESLTIQNVSGITDYTAILGKLEDIEELVISDSGLKGSGDLTQLKNLTLVDFSDSGFSDITLLPLVQLYTLDLHNTAVEDISALDQSEKLKFLDISGCPVKEADSLIPLEGLKNLDISDTKISSFSGNLNSLSIEKLNVSGSGLDSMTAFDDLTVLKELDFSDTACKEAECIKKSRETLKVLKCARTSLDPEMLSVIAGCKGVIELDISGISMDDLSVCKAMSSLSVISAGNCHLRYLVGLENKPLWKVYLSDNLLSDISSLNKLENYCYVDLRNNQLKDVSGLPGVRYDFLALNGEGNDISISGLPKDENADYSGISVNYTESLISQGSTLRKKTSHIYIVDCPQDKKLKITDVLGSSSGIFITNERLEELFSEYGMDLYKWDNYGRVK